MPLTEKQRLHRMESRRARAAARRRNGRRSPANGGDRRLRWEAPQLPEQKRGLDRDPHAGKAKRFLNRLKPSKWLRRTP